MKIQTVGVAGAGIMGQGITTTILLSGYNVILYDINNETLESGKQLITGYINKSQQLGKISAELAQNALSNLITTTTLTELVGELIIEAAPESLAIKQEIFKTVESVNSTETIFATNTSSLSVSQIGSCLINQKRFLGLHFFNPAPLMKLVEIVRSLATTPETVQIMRNFTESLQKQTVIAADTPGFIVNRIARFYYLESLRILEEQVANVETIDKLFEGTNFRMGPFRLMDLIGIDTNHEVTKSIYRGFFDEPRFRPSRIQQTLVNAGKFGKKTRSGFYEYPD